MKRELIKYGLKKNSFIYLSGIMTTKKGSKFIVTSDHGFESYIIYGWDIKVDPGIGDRHKTNKWNIGNMPDSTLEMFDIDKPPRTVSYNPHLY